MHRVALHILQSIRNLPDPLRLDGVVHAGAPFLFGGGVLAFEGFLEARGSREVFEVLVPLQEHFGIVLWRPHIRNRLTSTLQVLLQAQVVGGRDVVVLVGFKALASVLGANPELLQRLKDLGVDW
eukprot:CAMPEP_0202968480 /NCGR_PEP_ID=MMETSP1396-20130829/13806_1 /ASSEMBLY_ACC=CAM_ASM_000872 /TAXON_ID= /ORGANISM="Pseudokeronopsis sp., Strain Brazil" /LENGTH=124 /DNA_ID=CAMNT_0049694853 /DNA_START=150 /DNA_END=521 /DNA_ORIENTATION=-